MLTNNFNAIQTSSYRQLVYSGHHQLLAANAMKCNTNMIIIQQ